MPPLVTDRDEIVQWVRSFVGYSLDNNREELARLVAFPGDDPAQDVQVHTNCAMFALGIWRQLGARHPLLLGHYVNGMALTWALHIARDAGALYAAHDGDGPLRGDVCHYATSGQNNDHLEFLTSNPASDRHCVHAGGGRERNAITESPSPSDYTVNAWRPLRHYIDTPTVVRYLSEDASS